MPRFHPLPALLAGASLIASTGVGHAFDRYADRPPVMLSPNLVEPWTAQLRPSYRDVTGPVVMRTPMTAPPARSRYGQPTVIRSAAIDPTPVQRSPRDIDPRWLPTDISYSGKEAPGTLVIDTSERYLYLVEGGGKARRYGIGVGRPGFQWAGMHQITRKAEWPGWTPPAAMLKRKPDLPRHMDGGPDNPLGARALYIGSTEYRVHGTNEPWTIGQAVSSGCIRMRNDDVIDLYGRVKVGAKVKVL